MQTQQQEPLKIYYSGHDQCAPGHFWGPAVRPHYLLHIVLSGKGIFRYKNREWKLSAGDAFLIEPMETHYYQADDREPWAYAWVGFDGTFVTQILASTCFRNLPVYLHDTASLSPSPTEQAHFPDTPSLSYQEAIRLIVEKTNYQKQNHLELGGLLLTIFSQMTSPSEKETSDSEEQYCRTALEYIRNNYSYDIKVQDIADFIGIDRTYLYKIFKRDMGISPKQYLTQYRVREAGKMLQKQIYSITETAYSCGFRDAASFCATFRREIGITPRQYRERIRNRTF